MKTLKELKENKEEITEKGPGLWANIRAKRQRIKSGSGERMRKPGEKGAPSPDALQKAKGTSEDVAEAAFKDPSPMMKDSIKQDKIRSLKNLIAIAKVKGVHHKVKELELELKKLQEVTEASKPRTPMRDFLRRYPVPKDQVAKPVKKEKPPEKKDVNEAEGGGISVPATQQAINAKKRAQLAMKSADLKLKQAKEREAISKQRASLKEVNVMFSEAMAKKEKENAPSSKDKLKKGEALSGKQEPIDIKPELNTKKE